MWVNAHVMVLPHTHDILYSAPFAVYANHSAAVFRPTTDCPTTHAGRDTSARFGILGARCGGSQERKFCRGARTWVESPLCGTSCDGHRHDGRQKDCRRKDCRRAAPRPSARRAEWWAERWAGCRRFFPLAGDFEEHLYLKCVSISSGPVSSSLRRPPASRRRRLRGRANLSWDSSGMPCRCPHTRHAHSKARRGRHSPTSHLGCEQCEHLAEVV